MIEPTICKVAVVTGGTSGIGFACAHRFLRAGYRVGIFGQQEARVLLARDELVSQFGEDRVFAEPVDLRHSRAVTRFFDQVGARLGWPSILVCNAGYSPKRNGARARFAEIELDEWNDVVSVNLTGAMLCCQAALPPMASTGYGRIIFIGSVAARAMPRIAGAGYVASKAALAGLARTLVSEYAGTGITVNTIAPGRILTEMTGSRDSAANIAALRRIPTGRLGEPDDIAAVVEFLASKEAGFINGAVIDVNGGEYLPA